MSKANAMDCLIPLRLQEFERSTRGPLLCAPSPPPTAPLPQLPSKSVRRRRPRPATDLTIFPYTKREFKEVMEEVKKLYLKRQYKQCSARCIQVLESIKDSYRVHPLYQLHLSFFAASSLEESSRPLHLNSPAKLPLLQKALVYYQNTEKHMEYASFSTDPNIFQTRYNSSTPSSSSRLSTDSTESIESIESIFSSSGSTSTASSSTSQTPSLSSVSDDIPATHRRTVSAPTNPKLPSPKHKKKVSFSVQLPRISSQPELEPKNGASVLNSFPTPPSTSSPPSPPHTPITPHDVQLSRSLQRFRSNLSDLHLQITQHIRSVENQITALQKSRKIWRSNLPNIFTDLNIGETVFIEDKKKIELKARVEKLKERGWKRERFDGRKYEELCDKALSELK